MGAVATEIRQDYHGDDGDCFILTTKVTTITRQINTTIGQVRLQQSLRLLMVTTVISIITEISYQDYDGC